jgi:hypothetical protein
MHHMAISLALNPRRPPLHAPGRTVSSGRAAAGFQAGMGA